MLHGNVHRHLLILSLANWAVAIVCWSVSAYLGIAVPTSIFVYAVLFVIGLFAVVVAVAAYVLADFGVESGAAGGATPQAAVPGDGAGEPPA